MKINHLFRIALLSVVCLGVFSFTSCHNDDDDDEIINYEWGTVYLSPRLQNPGIKNRVETGFLKFRIEDNTLRYEITVEDLSSTDQLTMAHFHIGNPLTNGPVVLNFMPTFNGNKAEGSVQIRQSLIDSLKDNANEIYFNVHSKEIPTGLVRGQVNSRVIMAEDLALSGLNQTPAVITTATGTAALRLTSDNVLYSKVTVTGVEATDTLTMSHIHSGGLNQSGPVLVYLCSAINDFGIIKSQELSQQVADDVKNISTYVNVHSTTHPTGILRAQLKD